MCLKPFGLSSMTKRLTFTALLTYLVSCLADPVCGGSFFCFLDHAFSKYLRCFTHLLVLIRRWSGTTTVELIFVSSALLCVRSLFGLHSCFSCVVLQGPICAWRGVMGCVARISSLYHPVPLCARRASSRPILLVPEKDRFSWFFCVDLVLWKTRLHFRIVAFSLSLGCYHHVSSCVFLMKFGAGSFLVLAQRRCSLVSCSRLSLPLASKLNVSLSMCMDVWNMGWSTKKEAKPGSKMRATAKEGSL